MAEDFELLYKPAQYQWDQSLFTFKLYSMNLKSGKARHVTWDYIMTQPFQNAHF